MNQPDSEILTLDEVAVYLKAGKKTVYRLVQQGEIPEFKLGGTWRFRRSELRSLDCRADSRENAGQDMIAPQNDSNLATQGWQYYRVNLRSQGCKAGEGGVVQE